MSIIGREYTLVVEEHPALLRSCIEAVIPQQGRLLIRDLNFVSSEGTSRLGVRGRDGVTVTGDELPGDVEQIAIRPVWQLSDDEEPYQASQCTIRSSKIAEGTRQWRAARARRRGFRVRKSRTQKEPRSNRSRLFAASRMTQISELLDDSLERSWFFLGLLAVGLGAAHAIQPGHGKTLVTAVAAGAARPAVSARASGVGDHGDAHGERLARRAGLMAHGRDAG